MSGSSEEEWTEEHIAGFKDSISRAMVEFPYSIGAPDDEWDCYFCDDVVAHVNIRVSLPQGIDFDWNVCSTCVNDFENRLPILMNWIFREKVNLVQKNETTQISQDTTQ